MRRNAALIASCDEYGREKDRVSTLVDQVIPVLIQLLHSEPTISTEEKKLILDKRDKLQRFCKLLTTVIQALKKVIKNDSVSTRRRLGACSAEYTASHTQFTPSVEVVLNLMNTRRRTLRTNIKSLNSIIERPLSNNDDKDLDHKRAQAAIDISKIIPPRSRENRFARPPDKYPLGTTARTDHELQFSRARQYIHQYGPLLTSLDTNAAEIAQLAQPKKSIKKKHEHKKPKKSKKPKFYATMHWGVDHIVA